MGFRTGAFCKVWSVESVNEKNTKLRISISRKNKQTGEYEQEFSGFVSCLGAAAAQKAAHLHEGDRIRLGDVDVRTTYNREKRVTYTDFLLFSFELDDGGPAQAAPQKAAYDGGKNEPDDSDLPF